MDIGNVESCIEMTKLLKKAIKAHNNQTKNCLGGQGWDRHIFGLKTQGKFSYENVLIRFIKNISFKKRFS